MVRAIGTAERLINGDEVDETGAGGHLWRRLGRRLRRGQRFTWRPMSSSNKWGCRNMSRPLSRSSVRLCLALMFSAQL